MGLLSPEERALLASGVTAFPAPIPTQIVSSDEFLPPPQSPRQKQVEGRLKELGDDLAQRQGLSRRRFFQTASGMAAAFAVMNEVYGNVFEVAHAETVTPEAANARAAALKNQFVMDTHTHFLHEGIGPEVWQAFRGIRDVTRKFHWNPQMPNRPATNQDLMYDSYVKEMFLDSDTKVALISSAPADDPNNWFLSNGDMAAARKRVNDAAGSRRLLSHAIFAPGHPGWMEQVDQAIEVYKPDSWKGYTIDDNIHQSTSRYPWRLDDERLVYPAFEKFQKSGIRIVCVHKGLFPPSAEKAVPGLRNYVDVSDVGRAAKDWPDLTFVIYHSGYRHAGGGDPAFAMAEFQRTGRIDWVSDLAEIPQRWGVNNVYGDLGQILAETMITEPNLAAALMGTLVKGLGADHVIWGTDAVWTGSPQWQIEGLRRMEIPAALQKKYGYAPLGAADGPVKTGIFGGNVARLYGYQQHAELARPDRFANLKAEYDAAGAERSNLRYGFIRRG